MVNKGAQEALREAEAAAGVKGQEGIQEAQEARQRPLLSRSAASVLSCLT